MILGYRLDDYKNFGIKVPVCITLPKQTSNIIIAGKSGSGKSLSARWYLWQMLNSKESIVYISDYKGGEEYEDFEGSDSYRSGAEALKMIEDFYDFFTEVRNYRIRLQRHYTLFIEEWMGLLSYTEMTQGKKAKTDLMSKVGELLAVSRGLNMGVMLCIQRADSAYFSAGSREQFQGLVSYARCSNEQFRMLGFSGELEENPTQNYKAGQGLALIDGQDGVQEIIVPWIKNPDVLCQGIRSYLDRQSDIPSLTRAVAEGKWTGL